MKLENSFFNNISNLFSTSKYKNIKNDKIYPPISNNRSVKLTYNLQNNNLKISQEKNENCNGTSNVKSPYYDSIIKKPLNLNFTLRDITFFSNLKDNIHLNITTNNSGEIKNDKISFKFLSCIFEFKNVFNSHKSKDKKTNLDKEDKDSNFSEVILKYQTNNIILSSNIDYKKSQILSRVNVSHNLNDKIKSVFNLNLLAQKKNFKNNFSIGLICDLLDRDEDIDDDNDKKSVLINKGSRSFKNTLTSIIGMGLENIELNPFNFKKLESINMGIKYSTALSKYSHTFCSNYVLNLPIKKDMVKLDIYLLYQFFFSSYFNIKLVYNPNKNSLISIVNIIDDYFKFHSTFEISDFHNLAFSRLKGFGLALEIS